MIHVTFSFRQKPKYSVSNHAHVKNLTGKAQMRKGTYSDWPVDLTIVFSAKINQNDSPTWNQDEELNSTPCQKQCTVLQYNLDAYIYLMPSNFYFVAYLFTVIQCLNGDNASAHVHKIAAQDTSKPPSLFGWKIKYRNAKCACAEYCWLKCTHYRLSNNNCDNCACADENLLLGYHQSYFRNWSHHMHIISPFLAWLWNYNNQ